ncbi:MAG: integrase core domain-containing protein, partial [Candidatus Marinimicrobia bacterium]|nr:integrase core domain-containing protein [Candidatus Neomarinimicrobiota bacterium]
KYKLPRYQITARDVRSGTLFYFYTYEKSVTSIIISVKSLFEHLSKHGINPEKITIQVDNDSEFSEIRIHHDRGFKKYVKKNWNAKVKYILPHYPNANADVESSHRLIEDEFYSRASFSSIKDFLNKASAYQFYFNFLRKNSYKQFKTPNKYPKRL